MNVTWGGTHVLSTGDVQLCLHVLTTPLVALVQNVFPTSKGSWDIYAKRELRGSRSQAALAAFILTSG